MRRVQKVRNLRPYQRGKRTEVRLPELPGVRPWLLLWRRKATRYLWFCLTEPFYTNGPSRRLEKWKADERKKDWKRLIVRR